jgi:hypothetical protein
MLKCTVLKPGPARQVDPAEPGLGPVRVEVKTCLGVGPVKWRVDPGPRPPDQTRLRPDIYIDVKRCCFGLLKVQNNEE